MSTRQSDRQTDRQTVQGNLDHPSLGNNQLCLNHFDGLMQDIEKAPIKLHVLPSLKGTFDTFISVISVKMWMFLHLHLIEFYKCFKYPMVGTVGNGGMSKAVLCVMAPVGMSNPGGIYGTLVGEDSRDFAGL